MNLEGYDIKIYLVRFRRSTGLYLNAKIYEDTCNIVIQMSLLNTAIASGADCNIAWTFILHIYNAHFNTQARSI